MKYEEELKKICKNNKHSFYKRSDSQIELVRMFGDQVDSRFDIKAIDNKLECNYTFWVEGEGTLEQDWIFDYNEFLEAIENKMIKPFLESTSLNHRNQHVKSGGKE